MTTATRSFVCLLAALLFARTPAASAGEAWRQLKFDAGRSGNAPEHIVAAPLRLAGAVPLTDAVFTAPVVAGGRVYVVDGAGVAFCVDAKTLRVVWKFASPGGKAPCGNVSSPAIAGPYLHFGTTAGSYYVLDRTSGAVVKELRCGEPIFSAPVVGRDRVYFATLGARVYALEPDGTVCWVWDYLEEDMGFTGDRWDGEAWAKYKSGKVEPGDLFICSRDLAAYGRMLVVPAGIPVIWLEDTGDRAEARAVYRPSTATLGLSIGETGTVYRQWHMLDNRGQVELLRRRGDEVDVSGAVAGTETSARGMDLVSFSSVSVRGGDVFRTRPQGGFGLCRHSAGSKQAESLFDAASIAPPILLRDQAVYGDLNGSLHVVPLSGSGKAWSFKTAFGKAISAPAAACDGRIYFGCEDGYLYVLGPEGNASLPSKDLELWKIRSPLTSERADSKYDRFTSFGNFSNTNVDDQGLAPPFKIKWVRRFEGTTKHFSTCGGGRMYTHTAEGQIFAVEQETGRLLWRQYYPGVHVSYTSPLYYKERLLVPQAGLEKCRLRCLDAATGRLIWEAPFAGSPSWNRQMPPIIYKNLALYMFGTGSYGDDATLAPGKESVTWLFGHHSILRFPASHQPRVRAYDLETGRQVWERDFSEYGSGGDDAGLCLMDGTLYYSCFFGGAPRRKGLPSPNGVTAAMEPDTGRVIWSTTQYSVQGGCAVSGNDGRLYLGGYRPGAGRRGRRVWCLDANDGSLIWESDPLHLAVNVVTVGPRFVFVHGQRKEGYLLDKNTGKIVTIVAKGYKCTRFTLSEPYLLGSNLDVIDVSNVTDVRLVSSGPRVDPSECAAAMVSNGRIFYTGQGSGLQVSLVYGA
ncbi:MAG: PQQ-binding-like beta-propeller repeat protein, partial [Pirellulales bacterium]